MITSNEQCFCYMWGLEDYLKMVNNKSIMFKQLITVGSSKLFVAGNSVTKFIQFPQLGFGVLYVTRH